MTTLSQTLSLGIARTRRCLQGLAGHDRKAPIRLDFNIPRRRRLDWIRRTINPLPR